MKYSTVRHLIPSSWAGFTELDRNSRHNCGTFVALVFTEIDHSLRDKCGTFVSKFCPRNDHFKIQSSYESLVFQCIEWRMEKFRESRRTHGTQSPCDRVKTMRQGRVTENFARLSLLKAFHVNACE